MNCENFVEFVEKFKGFIIGRQLGQTKSVGNTGEQFENAIIYGISNAKIFEIQDNIKQLLMLTDSPKNNNDIHLPFPVVFLDVSFTKEELAQYGVDINANKVIGIMVKEGVLESKETGKVVGKDINITILLDMEVDGVREVWFDVYNKNPKPSEEAGISKFGKFKIIENPTTDKKSREFTYNFFLSFLNFTNLPDIQFVEHKRDEKNIQRRKKEGKAPIHSSYTINITGKTKQYIDYIHGQAKMHFDHAWWNRGHYRVLKSERYKNKKRIWIFPYLKGVGPIIQKNYQLK